MPEPEGPRRRAVFVSTCRRGTGGQEEGEGAGYRAGAETGEQQMQDKEQVQDKEQTQNDQIKNYYMLEKEKILKDQFTRERSDAREERAEEQ